MAENHDTICMVTSKKAYSYLINDISKDKKVCHKKKNYVWKL